jgi:hypothetical protein
VRRSPFFTVLSQVVHSSQTGKIRVDAGFTSPSVHTCEFVLESPTHKQGQVRLGDVVRIKSSLDGSYLCVDLAKSSSFDSKGTFNFSMYVLRSAQMFMQLLNHLDHRYAKDIIDKNHKLIFEFTIRDERGREKQALGTNVFELPIVKYLFLFIFFPAVLSRRSVIEPRPSIRRPSSASVVRESSEAEPRESAVAFPSPGMEFQCELGAGFAPRLRGLTGITDSHRAHASA